MSMGTVSLSAATRPSTPRSLPWESVSTAGRAILVGLVLSLVAQLAACSSGQDNGWTRADVVSLRTQSPERLRPAGLRGTRTGQVIEWTRAEREGPRLVTLIWNGSPCDGVGDVRVKYSAHAIEIAAERLDTSRGRGCNDVLVTNAATVRLPKPHADRRIVRAHRLPE